MAEFIIGDYRYTTISDEEVLVRAVDKTKYSYSDIPRVVEYGGDSYIVTKMSSCFYGCSSLTTSPNIPEGVTNMNFCFYGCSSLTTPPNIPEGVTNMSYCFHGCSSLTTPPNIPEGVTDMSDCFRGCSSLTTSPNIPEGVTNMNFCFYGCRSLTGNIAVNSTPKSTGLFLSTVLPIYIINKSEPKSEEVSTFWRGVAERYPNVHFEVDDAIINTDSISFNIKRTDTDSDEEYEPSGSYLFASVSGKINEESFLYLPVGWDSVLKPDSRTLSIDSEIVTDYIKWSESYDPIEKTFNVKAWYGYTDKQSHTIGETLYFHVIDENAIIQGTILVTVSALLSSAIPLVSYKAGGTGIAFGKISESDAFECALHAIFEDQIHTSFKSSVAMGSYGSPQTTIPNFVDEVRYSSGAAGSVEIDTAYTKDDVTIPAGWYSFMYMPHRTGGKNGQVEPAAIDNVEYGNLLLFGFASGSGRYDITIEGGIIGKLVKLITSENIRKSPTTSTHTKNVGKIAANTYKNCETDTFTPTAAQSGLTPVVSGWDVTGTGTASCQIMGVYLSGNATNGYVGHIKLKNDSTSQIGDVTIEVRLLWV